MDKGSSLFRRVDRHYWLVSGFMKHFKLDENDHSDCLLAINFLERIGEI